VKFFHMSTRAFSHPDILRQAANRSVSPLCDQMFVEVFFQIGVLVKFERAMIQEHVRGRRARANADGKTLARRRYDFAARRRFEALLMQEQIDMERVQFGRGIQ
jgi:DNA invertase Pin-like site-specific DNA recombinase